MSGQIEAVEGLLAIGRVWSSTGYPEEAEQARTIGVGIGQALRPAVGRGSKRLRDGSLFVPDQLASAAPFARLTASRDGSYWNLVMPYAFASGWFAAHSQASRGILRYLLQHGSRLLGVPRTYARTVYGDVPGAGLAQVYGLSMSRFFADNDQPDQLVLSLYGMLAAGMTADTYVSGEAVSVLPVRRRLRTVDVHAAELRRERLVPRHAARAARARAAWAARRAGGARPRVLDAARVARRRTGDRRAWCADELRQGDATRSTGHGSHVEASSCSRRTRALPTAAATSRGRAARAASGRLDDRTATAAGRSTSATAAVPSRSGRPSADLRYLKRRSPRRS